MAAASGKADPWWWLDYFPFAALLVLLFAILFAFNYVEGVFQAEMDHLRRQIETLDGLLRKGNLERQRLLEERKILADAVSDLLVIRNARRRLVGDLERRLKPEGFALEFDADHGILRLPVDGLFPSGSDQVVPRAHLLLNDMGRALEELLPAYLPPIASAGATGRSERHLPGADLALPASRESSSVGLECLLIEGHTDDQPVHPGSPFKDNWNLSAARAIKVLNLLLQAAPKLSRLENQKSQTLLAIGGYGDQRPISSNETESGRQRNRRIELRFIMSSSKAGLPSHPLLKEILPFHGD